MALVELNMECITCLQPSSLNCLPVQNAQDNLIEEALRKHFWFTDFRLASICQPCWNQVRDFHRFYVSVEELYNTRMLASVITKPEPEVEGFVIEELDLALPECSSSKVSYGESQALDDNAHVDEEVLTEFSVHELDMKDVELYEDFRVMLTDCLVKKPQVKTEQLEANEEPAEKPDEQIEDQREVQQSHDEQEEAVQDDPEYCPVKRKRQSTQSKSNKRKRPKACEKSFACRQCSKTFDSKYRLNVHKEEHQMQIYSCTRCNEMYSDGETLQLHMQECWSDASICDICNLVLPNKDALVKHNAQEHNSNQQVHDEHRLERFGEQMDDKSESEESDVDLGYVSKKHVLTGAYNGSSVDSYIREHVKFICNQCGLESQTFVLLKTHALRAHGNSSPFLVCCGKKFTSRFQLVRHVQMLRHPDVYQCRICETNFNRSEALRQHMKIVHPNEGRDYPCNRCPKKFVSQFLLNVHTAIHTGENSQSVECTICGKVFDDEKKLRAHIGRVHSDSLQFVCEICSKGFHTKHRYTSHKLVHEKHPCLLCPEVFLTTTELRAHGLLAHPNAMICYTCEQVLPSKEILLTHKDQQHQTNLPEQTESHGQTDCVGEIAPQLTEQPSSKHIVKPLIFKFVPESARDDLHGQAECSSDIEEPAVQQEDGVPKRSNDQQAEDCRDKKDGRPKAEDDFIRKHVKYICQQCGKESRTFSNYRQHAIADHGIQTPSLECCGYVYYHRYRLLQHVQKLQNPERFSCAVCQTCYMQKNAYIRHMNTFHASPDRRFKCKECPNSFDIRSLYLRHIAGHKDPKKEKTKCVLCGIFMRSTNLLIKHLKKVHPDAPKFSCDVCSEVFLQESWFLRHKMGHKE